VSIPVPSGGRICSCASRLRSKQEADGAAGDEEDELVARIDLHATVGLQVRPAGIVGGDEAATDRYHVECFR